MNKEEYTLDAENKPLGRIASEAAVLLRGKNTAAFERHVAPKVRVTIINASKIKIFNNKLQSRYHKHYTGFPGGLRKETWAQTTVKKGYRELIKMAIQGMIPNTKLRPNIMKNVTISE